MKFVIIAIISIFATWGIVKLVSYWLTTGLANAIEKKSAEISKMFSDTADAILAHPISERREEYFRLYRNYIANKHCIEAVMLFDNIVDRKIIEKRMPIA